jgi:hypothetical protein
MGKADKQAEASGHIQTLLHQRGLNLLPRSISILGEHRWAVFEHEDRHIGIDESSGLWVKLSINSEWRCIATPCTVSASLQAVEFIVSAQDR